MSTVLTYISVCSKITTAMFFLCYVMCHGHTGRLRGLASFNYWLILDNIKPNDCSSPLNKNAYNILRSTCLITNACDYFMNTSMLFIAIYACPQSMSNIFSPTPALFSFWTLSRCHPLHRPSQARHSSSKEVALPLVALLRNKLCTLFTCCWLPPTAQHSQVIHVCLDWNIATFYVL